MKRLKLANKLACIGCMECATACAKAFFKEENPSKACLKIVSQEDGSFSPKVCIQCGKCQDICPVGAISQNKKGVYIIDKEQCLGCGACDDICPMDVMVFFPGQFVAKCIACGICVRACNQGVLEVFTKE